MLPLPWHSNAIAAAFSLCSPNTVADGQPQCCSCRRLIVACRMLFSATRRPHFTPETLPRRHHCTATVFIRKRPPPPPHTHTVTCFCHPAAITERRHYHRFPCAAMTLCRQLLPFLPVNCRSSFCRFRKQGTTRGFSYKTRQLRRHKWSARDFYSRNGCCKAASVPQRCRRDSVCSRQRFPLRCHLPR